MASDNMSTVIVIASILLLSLLYLSNNSPIENDGSLQRSSCDQEQISNEDDSYNEENSSDDSSYILSEDDSVSVSQVDSMNDDSVDSSIAIIDERSRGRNNMYFKRKNGNKIRHNSYRSLDSGSLRDVAPNFKVPDVTKNYTDRYVPVDESDGNEAPINISSKKDTEMDKYNVNSFLPQEEEKDWFETIETVNVKNSHLINIYRPIGVNTIGSTNKNASYDIRGTGKAVAPKFVVSPWLQSSIEPDRNMKSLC